MFLPGVRFGDNLVSEIFGCVELTHSTECLKPAFVDNELVSGVRVGSCDFERLVEISERVIVGAQLHVSLPTRGQITNSPPGTTKHPRAHESPRHFLAG